MSFLMATLMRHTKYMACVDSSVKIIMYYDVIFLYRHKIASFSWYAGAYNEDDLAGMIR